MMKKTFATLFAAVLGLAALAPARAADNLTMADFGHSIKLQVSGYAGSETLANFPVLVHISEAGIPGFDYDDTSAWNNTHTTTYGYDLAFFSEDGTRLASEVDTWKHNGESLVWVKIPSMTQGTKFWMCYNVASGVYVTNDSPWSDYVGVWHLKETGGSGKVVNDSSPNGMQGKTFAGGTYASSPVGAGRKIAGDKNHAYGIVVDATNAIPQKAVADSLETSFTASFWMNPQGSKVADFQYGFLIDRRKGEYNNPGGWGVRLHDGTAANKQQLQIYAATEKPESGNYNGTLTSKNYPSLYTLNTWTKVDIHWYAAGAAGAADIYTNGVFVETVTLPNAPAQTDSNIGIGGSTQDNPQNSNPTAQQKGRRFNGYMDEVRLRSGSLSADWIKADYDTVNDPSFVTIAPPVVTWTNGTGATPGVASVHKDHVSFAGTVTDCGGSASCAIQCKVWATGGTEPSEWTTLTNGLVALESFTVTVSGLTSETSYDYRLRAVGTGESASTPVSGSFTTLAGLAVSWSSATSATGLSEIGHDHVVVAGEIGSLGAATACEIQCKIWQGETEPETWTTLTNGLAAGDAFQVAVGGKTPLTDYNYALRAVGNDNPASTTTPVTGSFTTAPGLTVAWTSATASAGLSKIAPDFVTASGSVSALGDATACDIQAKVWFAGDSAPGRWTTIVENLGLNASFNVTVRETATGDAIAPGTAYAYALRAVGNDGEETVPVTGTFTTDGEQGAEIGSDYTHFFDDGTNACWVVNGFERYLPFTVTGYTGTETLTNFPVLVDVRASDTNGFTYDDFYHYDGEDMAFVDDTGHLIPHEIDTWNKTGMSLIWVRLPRMNNGTTFTMCYRSPLVDPLPDVGNTFEKYVGVWHMNETQDGVVALKDSTTNALPGEAHAKSLAGINQGQMIGGNARRVAQETGTSSSNGRIMVYDHDDILRTGVGNVFTFSGWYKVADTKPNWAYLVARKGDDYSKGWGIQYTDNKDGNDKKMLRVWSDPKGNKGLHVNGKAGGYYHFGIQTYGTGETTGYNHTDWSYWTFVFSNSTFHAFYNGAELASTAGGFTLEEPFANDETADFDFLVIGGQEFGTGAFNGWVDEARYSKGVRSADWIKAEYDSTRQKDVAFVTKGTVGKGTDSLVPVVVWEQGANLPVSIIDVSYAYVQFAGTVTFCGVGADECRIEYQLWADGEEDPTIDGAWTTLGELAHATAGTSFSVPVTGLKQDMPYNFRIRAVNTIETTEGEKEQANRERTGSFRTNGNVVGSGQGELLRIDNRFVHRYRAGSYTFTTPDYVTSVEIMVVGGGGAGGYKIGGGGGGGGLFYSESFPVESNTTYRIQVGQGGNAATDLSARGGNGERSYFARVDGPEEEDEVVLIQVDGGGAGGSSVNNAAIATGADGGSGGGGSFALAGGSAISNEVDGVWVTYGHEGGQGNDSRTGGNQLGKTAAGGGGGAAREGVTASFDSWYGGGAGGAGLGNSMTGELLFYGAGGGGGYAYRTDGSNYSKPGAGGSGIGGNAADVRNGTPATSGVENTGAGGGGGSMTLNSGDQTYWQGGDGGDGVVLIAYEVHGRDPISEEPRITMSRCDYDPDAGTTGTGAASIDYRAFWAGIQAQTNDIYVLYSNVSSNDVAVGNGDVVKVSVGAIGIGSTTFVPPEVGCTYWVRLMARKDGTSFMYSDEIATFYVPAVTLKAATWKKQSSASSDYAIIDYKLHDLDEATHLYCYWSESREALEGDDPPTGDGVRLLDLGTGRANAEQFNLPASEGLSRNRLYYVRLAAGDAKGLKHNLSIDILPLDTSDNPAVALVGHNWTNNVATLQFRTTLSFLDPADTTLFAYYSTTESLVKKNQQTNSVEVTFANLGLCSSIPDEKDTTASFPLWATETTNYYVRLALYSAASNKWYYSGSTRTITITTPIAANTLLIVANANPKIACYGDEPQTLDYTVTYGGLTEGPGWDHKPSVVGSPACTVTATSATGQYDITQGSIALSSPEPWIENGTTYQYLLVFAGAKYAVTDAVFTATVADVERNYSGDPLSVGDLTKAETGVRNDQTVTYSFREGSGEWSATPPASYVDAGTYTVQFKASAPNHASAYGTFQIVVKPAKLVATINDVALNYTGAAQTPAVATNVTGHVKPALNPLTCEFREEAGEWQAEVPSFTQPGNYTLWFRASASNHVTAVTNCTVTVTGWDFMVNMDGQTGYPTPIFVTDPGWLLDVTGLTGQQFADRDTRLAKLDEVQPNGLKLWQNYVIERTDLTKKLVAAVVQSGSRVNEGCFVVHFPDVEGLRNTGLNIKYRLDRKLVGESEFTQGALTDKYETNVPLGPGDPSGLYVFNMVLTPTNGPGRSVLSSVTTAGVLRVTSSLTNTVTAVPWASMATDSAESNPVSVAETVNPNGLSAGDEILAYDAASGVFRAWTRAADNAWKPVTTVTPTLITSEEADAASFARGDAFWLVRSDASDPFHLVGRHVGGTGATQIAPGSAAEPKSTLCANPTGKAISFKDLVFDGEIGADDTIVVTADDGIPSVYVWNASKNAWGYWRKTLVGRRIQSTWVEDGSVSPGMGFWYVRRSSGTLSITWPAFED